jgi:hypothetical protein
MLKPLLPLLSKIEFIHFSFIYTSVLKTAWKKKKQTVLQKKSLGVATSFHGRFSVKAHEVSRIPGSVRRGHLPPEIVKRVLQLLKVHRHCTDCGHVIFALI